MRGKTTHNIILITFFAVFLVQMVYGATITVTNTNDSGAGSLRQAVSNAASGDTIDFSVTGTITLTTGELVIGKNLSITGPGASSLTIDGNNTSRIFMVNSGFTLTLSDVTIDNGNSGTWGGGIANEGTLHLSDSVINNCDANGGGNGYGGAIDSYNGTLTVTNCTLTANTAVNRGGGIHIENGACTITESTISGNTSDNGGGIYSLGATTDVIRSTVYNNNATAGGSNYGGGIFTQGGTVNVTNSTVSGNNAVSGGGGIIDGAATTLSINSSTIVYNVSTSGGGGLEMDSTTVNIKNTILAHNTGGGANNFFSGGGTLNSQGYNLENGTECGFTGTGDQQSVSAGLDPIADNGGPTQTHALQAGSNAVDVIPGPGYNGAPGTDQRGVARPQSTGTDCGAFELQQAPQVTTQAVSGIATTSATGNGTITNLGAPNPTAHGMVWNTTGNPTLADNSTDEGPAAATGAFTSNMTGLSSYTTYYVKAYATNANGTAYGNEVSFTTQGTAPAVTTQAVSGIAATSAVGNGTITNLGAPNPTVHGMVWNTTGNPTLADNSTNEGPAAAIGAFTSNMTGLAPYTTYYVKAYATNAGGTAYGNEVSYTTQGIAPAVTTQAVSGIAATSAVGNGTITNLGTPNPTAHGMVWNTTGNPTLADSSTNEGPAAATGAFTSSITGLSAGMTYYVRAYATNVMGTAYGNDVSFTTHAAPTVTTAAVSGVTATTATGGGNVTADGGSPVTARGVCWSTAPNPTTADSLTVDGTGTGSFTSAITGLNSGITYHVRAYATNSAGTAYGSDVSFTTHAAPTVTTAAVSGITATAATGGGNVTADGGSPVTARGVCWSTAPNPTTADSLTVDGTGTGSFTSSLTGLGPGTTYYVRAYASNAVGTAYGSPQIFTTTGDMPTVSTIPATDITSTSAAGGGRVTDAGSSAVTSRGVCWDTSPGPTVGDQHTNDGSGTGGFSSYLAPLIPATRYYYRAFATNSFGTSYGGEEEFTTPSQAEPPSIEIISPIDGSNVCGVVPITAKAVSKMGIKRVDFYVDDEKIGEGMNVPAGLDSLSFDMTGATVLFTDSQHRLNKRDADGNTSAVLNVDIEIGFLYKGPDGHIYTIFKSPQKLADGSFQTFVKMDPRNGRITGIEPPHTSLYTGFKNSPIIQFSGSGDLFYFTVQDNSSVSLRRFINGENRGTFFRDDDAEIHEWLVRDDGSVIIGGKTKSTGRMWLRRVDANREPVKLTELFSRTEWICESGDGCSYAGTMFEVYRISGDRMVEISPGLLPAEMVKKEKKRNYFLDVNGIPDAGERFTADWDTSLCDFGLHTIRVIATDGIDQTAEDTISVNIPEIILTITASRETEKAWIIKRIYANLVIQVENLSLVPVSEYVIYRKVAGGSYEIINSFTDGDLTDGVYRYNDTYLERDITYTYKVEALDMNGNVLAESIKILL